MTDDGERPKEWMQQIYIHARKLLEPPVHFL